MAGSLKDPAGIPLRVAEVGYVVVGSIVIVKLDVHTVQLRWFAVGSVMRGMGVGNALMDTAMAFCREKGYTALELWTLDILLAAKRLYREYWVSRWKQK